MDGTQQWLDYNVKPKKLDMSLNLPIRIIGIGSPHGDDQIGWSAAEYLKSSSVCQVAIDDGIEILSYATPFDGFLEAAQQSKALIVLDAVVSGSPVGTVMRIEEETLPSILSPYSSHGMGIAEIIALARAMELLPAHVVVLGVEISQAQPLAALQLNMDRICQRLEQLVLDELEFLRYYA